MSDSKKQGVSFLRLQFTDILDVLVDAQDVGELEPQEGDTLLLGGLENLTLGCHRIRRRTAQTSAVLRRRLVTRRSTGRTHTDAAATRPDRRPWRACS